MQKKLLKKHHRLQEIAKLITKHYDHIWDCCCDHGLLGITLLKSELAQTIHFVDIVPELLNSLQFKLEQFWQGDKNAWNIHCADIKELPIYSSLHQDSQEKHLIIIAGVGGELLIEFMRALLVKTANLNVEFILCPVHHNYKVREFLYMNCVGLISEKIVEENGRYYEILHVSVNSGVIVSHIGDKQWDLTKASHLVYLQQTINHYTRIANSTSSDVEHILNSYQALLNKC